MLFDNLITIVQYSIICALIYLRILSRGFCGILSTGFMVKVNVSVRISGHYKKLAKY